MTYQEVKTDGYLSNFIKCFWASENLTDEVEHTILPDGYFDLIVEIDNEKVSRIKLTGIWSIPIHVKLKSNTKILAVRCKPLATELIDNIDFKSLLNSSTSLPFGFFEFRTNSFESFENFQLHIAHHFNKKIATSKSINEKKINLFNLIFKKEIFTVKALSEKVFWASRQMNRYFNLHYGISLKVYLNIVRCHAAYKAIAKNEEVLHTDYFDQSHFIKEIKKFTGVSPKELLRNKDDRFLQLSTIKEL
jgi:AraC-like DNA-binding protein